MVIIGLRGHSGEFAGKHKVRPLFLSAFMPVPGIMQTVQRAEFWGAIVAMQAYWPCHLGIDNYWSLA